MQKINRRFLKGTWNLTKIYWMSEEKWRSRLLLAVIVGLNIGYVYLTVLFNSWYNSFYDALQNHDTAGIFSALRYFSVLAAFNIVVCVYQQYLQQLLEIRWRRWITEHYLKDWLNKRTYYLLQLLDKTTDNPDQRISEDLRDFVSLSLNLSLGFLQAASTLVCFVVILWNLSGSISIPLGGHHQFTVPGYLVWAAIIYSFVGTWLTAKIGHPLVNINFNQQRYEADFRFSLVRLRENSEGIALYGGENQEQAHFTEKFKNVFNNFRSLIKRQKKLTWLTSGYSQIAIIFPIVVAMPRFLRNEIQLGGLMQIADAFGSVQTSLSYFVNSYSSLAQWQAVVNRLTGFVDNIDRVSVLSDTGAIQVGRVAEPALSVEGLTIALPSGQRLLDSLELELKAGDSLLITGPSGCGKSTLLRTLAGIWPFGQGNINIPLNHTLLFLPQKPYLPLGTLKDVLLYPYGTATITDETIQEVMVVCKLEDLIGRLDKVENWSQILSIGEQQRIAFARAILQRPEWLFLDEATSALDEPAEQAMYKLLHERLEYSSIISVGHRSTLIDYHKMRLNFAGAGRWDLQNT